jgi:hypothetical protein
MFSTIVLFCPVADFSKAFFSAMEMGSENNYVCVK